MSLTPHRASMSLTPHRITIVGAGPGAPEYVTPAARDAVEAAEVLVGAQRLLDLFPHATAERIVVTSPIDKLLAAVERAAGRRVVVLVTGDAGLMSLARPIVARFGRPACAVIPGVSSVQVAFARLALDWQGATILDAHGSAPDLSANAARHAPKIAVLLGCTAAAGWLSDMGKTLEPTHRIVAFSDLTLSTESVEEPPPSALGSLAGNRRTIVLFIHKELLP